MKGMELPVDPQRGIRVGRARRAGDGPAPPDEVELRFEVRGPTDVKRLLGLVRTLLERNRQLEHALASRVVIEQAKGVLAERLGRDPEAAFDVLRRAARSNRTSIHELAGRVVVSPETPPEIVEALAS